MALCQPNSQFSNFYSLLSFSSLLHYKVEISRDCTKSSKWRLWSQSFLYCTKIWAIGQFTVFTIFKIAQRCDLPPQCSTVATKNVRPFPLLMKWSVLNQDWAALVCKEVIFKNCPSSKGFVWVRCVRCCAQRKALSGNHQQTGYQYLSCVPASLCNSPFGLVPFFLRFH